MARELGFPYSCAARNVTVLTYENTAGMVRHGDCYSNKLTSPTERIWIS